MVTHSKVFNPPSKLGEALKFARSVTDAPACRLLRPGNHYLDHLFSVMQEADARGNLVFDAQIVALCQEHVVSSVLTNDRDFERFVGISVDYLEDRVPSSDPGMIKLCSALQLLERRFEQTAPTITWVIRQETPAQRGHALPTVLSIGWR